MERIKQIVKRNIRWIILLISLVAFIAIAEDVWEKEVLSFDTSIYQIVSIFICQPITSVFKVITNLGSAIPLIAISIATILFLKNKNYGKYISINLVVITILSVLMKNIFQRPRPTEHRIIDETGYSFPSAHSMVNMAFYGFLVYLIYKYVDNKYLKWTLCTLLTFLILAIGISRIYLGVHYPSDVLGGFCFSLVYLALYTNIIKGKLEKNKKEDNN